jgi:hypothetical protein
MRLANVIEAHEHKGALVERVVSILFRLARFAQTLIDETNFRRIVVG